MIRVLSVASESVPLVKTGGLADVVGALPGALKAHGVEMKVLIPGYREVLAGLGAHTPVTRIDNLYGASAEVVAAQVDGHAFLVLDAPHLFDRDGGPYTDGAGNDWWDNPERFAALCMAAAHLAVHGADGWRPDIVHGHDWQAGLVPEYLRVLSPEGHIPFVQTIHNMAFLGMAGRDRLESLGLNPARFTSEGFEFWGQISALKAGLVGADRITTVSQTYAEELMTGPFGNGLDGLMRHRRADFRGILNGIDLGVWNPASDGAIAKPYKSPRAKAANKLALRQEFSLPGAEGPLCVVVSRLTRQKGIDLLLEALPALLARGGQLVVLGTGDAALEAGLRKAANDPNVAFHRGYDEAMAHRLVAGGDAILVPSRFEPCGLTQLYGLRYGTLPLVALTGGLADTVINASPAALAMGVATGVQVFPVTGEALETALSRLCNLWERPETWGRMQRNAMKQPVGWDSSAKAYAALYAEVMPGS